MAGTGAGGGGGGWVHVHSDYSNRTKRLWR